MKIAELNEIKAKMNGKVVVTDDSTITRVTVGMATCGIAAGARPVLEALTEAVEAAGLADTVKVTQVGCIGICQYEPVFEVFAPGKERVTYVNMTADKAKEVAEKHLKGGEVVAEYTIGNK